MENIITLDNHKIELAIRAYYKNIERVKNTIKITLTYVNFKVRKLMTKRKMNTLRSIKRC